MRDHGTKACYVFGPDPGAGQGCRCDECRAASTRYEHARTHRATPAYVAADTARAHIRELARVGVGLNTVAERSGVSHGALWKLIYGMPGRGPSERIRPGTEAAILAVTPADAADGAKVDATRTWEHVDTLRARGWTKKAIAEAIGQKGPGLQLGKTLVTAGNARAIKTLLGQPVPPRGTRYGPIETDWTAEKERANEVRKANEAERRARYRAAAGGEPASNDALPELRPVTEPWRTRAACAKSNIPTWMFYPRRGDTATAAKALDVCATCPVRRECLESALADPAPLDLGIRGGLTEDDRAATRQEMTA